MAKKMFVIMIWWHASKYFAGFIQESQVDILISIEFTEIAVPVYLQCIFIVHYIIITDIVIE